MAEARRGRIWLLIPPLIFLALAGISYWALQREDPNALPSQLAEKAAPELKLAELRPGEAPPTRADLTGPGIKLVNFWASWCAPCRVEHPILMDLAERGVPIIGVNYKDKRENALGFLEELGDPYAKVGADESGRTGIDWGLYGVPETFVIDGNGTVLLRHAGPITPEIFTRKIEPLLGE